MAASRFGDHLDEICIVEVLIMLVEIEAKGKVRVLRMQNGKDNRFNTDFVDALNHALDTIEADGGARAIVVTAAQEKYFSNGIDIEWVTKSGPGIMQVFFPNFLRMLERFFMFPKPVVAAINGHSFAGGFFFAMTADYRIMRADRGWCCANEIDLDMGLSRCLLVMTRYAVGNRLAQRIVTTGERFTAEASEALGIVDQTAAREELLDRAIETADMLGSKSPQRYAEYKRDLRGDTSLIILEDAENYSISSG
jgi:enoyl-CoA hydratase/carnithine racemase